MVSAIITGRFKPVECAEILCYYFNESTENQIVDINKNHQATEVVLLPKHGIFFEAMPQTLIKIYRSMFSGREIVDAIRCKALHVSEKAQATSQYKAIA